MASPRVTDVPTGRAAATGSKVLLRPPSCWTTTTARPAMTPVHETRPSVGARTGWLTDAARSTPRWPDVHARVGGSNRRATSGSGSRGQDHRSAGVARVTRRSLAGPGPADVDATALALVTETVARTAPSSADPIDMPPCSSSPDGAAREGESPVDGRGSARGGVDDRHVVVALRLTRVGLGGHSSGCGIHP